MSIKIVESKVRDFLSNDTPEVLAIKGVWGVGKTYSWDKFLLDAKRSEGIALERYSYVSLFGINSLDALKYTMFEHVLNKNMIGRTASVETFKNNTISLMERFGRKSLGLFKDSSVLKNFTPAIESISFLSLNKSLICIDDLERKGLELSMRDVLGLVSQLKEQKGCKVVLLLNDKEEGMDEYEKYKEKIVDVELKFDPTSLESAEVAFNSDEEGYKEVSKLTQSLDIKNIRILKKIERLLNLTLPLIKGCEPELIHQVRHSIVLFSWCYYRTDDEVPTLDFVTNQGYDLWGLNEEKESANNKLWKSLISEYGYGYTDELDIVLSESVKTGYIEENNFSEKVLKRNEQLLRSRSEGSFNEAWNLYHNNFDNNKDELIEELFKSFKLNVENISPTNLNGTVKLLRELGEEEKASEAIDIYIRARAQEEKLFNMKENNFFGDIKDRELVERFNEKYSSMIESESIRDVLKRISGSNGWGSKDEETLVSASVDEYYQMFKEERGDHLSSYVYTCLKFGQFMNASDRYKEISAKATEALKMIAKESELNRLRVSKFGVELDP